MSAPEPASCEGFRASVSARLDGELGWRDAASHQRHVERCAECRAYAQGVRAATLLVRGTPLQRPRPLPPVFAPRRRGVRGVIAVVAAALALALAFAIAAAPRGREAPRRAAPAAVDVTRLLADAPCPDGAPGWARAV